MTQETEDHLPSYNIRPRFKLSTSQSAEDIYDNISESLKVEGSKCIGQLKPRFITLFILNEEQHYWSPQLTITMDEEEDECTVRGVYSPRPTVWTMFVFFYSIIGLAIFIIGVMGLSFISLGKPATILWLVPILGIILLTLYLVAYFGQKLGHDQMEILHRFFEQSTGLITHV